MTAARAWLLLALVTACGGSAEAPTAEPAPPVEDDGPFVLPGSAKVGFLDAEGNAIAIQRYGELFTVRAQGLSPGAAVTLRSSLWGYRGWASYVADEEGVVDTRYSEALDGTYQGVHPEGLLWSMEQVSEDSDEGYDVTVAVEIDGAEQHRSTLNRLGLDLGVNAMAFEHPSVVAEVFRPNQTDGPLPAVLILGGSEGGIDSARFKAAWLAAYGYTAMALAYFDEPGLPSDLLEIPLEYFGEALDALAARDDVDPSRIAVLGGSRGSEAALMVGARYPQVKAVVATAPSGLRWASVYDANAAAWIAEGAPLPFVPTSPNAAPSVETLPDGTSAWNTTPQFLTSIADADPQALEAATIPVEQIQGPVLLLGGADDGIWPSCEMAQIAMDRLTASGHAADHGDSLLCFEEAGHVGTSPGWPTTDGNVADFGSYAIVIGGTAQGNHDAMRGGLDATRAFLEEALAP